MLFEPQFAEGRGRVFGNDLRGRAVGKKRDRDGHEPFDKMRVAISAKVDSWLVSSAVRRGARLDPDLADATAHTIVFVSSEVRKRFQRASQLDDIAVPVVPVIEQREILADGFYFGQGTAPDSGLKHTIVRRRGASRVCDDGRRPRRLVPATTAPDRKRSTIPRRSRG